MRSLENKFKEVGGLFKIRRNENPNKEAQRESTKTITGVDVPGKEESYKTDRWGKLLEAGLYTMIYSPLALGLGLTTDKTLETIGRIGGPTMFVAGLAMVITVTYHSVHRTENSKQPA